MAEQNPQDDHYYAVLIRDLEHTRAECNRLASERDLAVTERDEAKAENRRLKLGVENLLSFNRTLSDRLVRALSPERSAA